MTPSGQPHVAPVWPAFHDGDIWVAVGLDYIKVRNVRANPSVNLHYQVTESNDMETLIIWGDAAVRTGVEIRRRMWNGVFNYDLAGFAPDGPEDAETIGFLQITMDRAVLAGSMGSGPRRSWVRQAGGGS